MELDELRIDKWLWCARLFKTRTIDAEDYKSGKVKVNEVSMKPSQDVKCGEIISVQLGQLHKMVEVLSIPKSRFSPKDLSFIYIFLSS